MHRADDDDDDLIVVDDDASAKIVPVFTASIRHARQPAAHRLVVRRF